MPTHIIQSVVFCFLMSDGRSCFLKRYLTEKKFIRFIRRLMMKKHPDVKEKGKTIDMSDLEADPVVMWQKR